MTPCWGSCYPPVSIDVLDVEVRVDSQHVGLLRPLDDCRKMASSQSLELGNPRSPFPYDNHSGWCLLSLKNTTSLLSSQLCMYNNSLKKHSNNPLHILNILRLFFTQNLNWIFHILVPVKSTRRKLDVEYSPLHQPFPLSHWFYKLPYLHQRLVRRSCVGGSSHSPLLNRVKSKVIRLISFLHYLSFYIIWCLSLSSRTVFSHFSPELTNFMPPSPLIIPLEETYSLISVVHLTIAKLNQYLQSLFILHWKV